VAENLGENGFYLPNGLGMSDDQLEQAVSISREVLGQRNL
jgi:dTDP-4-amino-4,6-dideoxygalactose transaminase